MIASRMYCVAAGLAISIYSSAIALEPGSPAFDRVVAKPPIWWFAPRGMSGDGNVLLGTARTAEVPNHLRMARWTVENGVEVLDTEPGRFTSTAWCSSFDGSIIAGDRSLNPVVWTKEYGFRKLYLGIGSSLQSVYWISDDGMTASVSAPSMYPPSHAFSWSEQSGIVSRGFPAETLKAAFSIGSRNGRYFAWASAGDIRIREPDGTTSDVAGIIADRRLYYSAISNDGASLAGWFSTPGGDIGLFRMDRSGTIREFPMPQGYSSVLTCVYSADLSCAAITGAAYLPHRPSFPSYFALYWRENEGLHPLHAFAGGLMPIFVSDNGFASAISDDGSVVYGHISNGVTNPAAPPETVQFRVRLDPKPFCAGDGNGDRVVDDRDFISFARSYDELVAPFADQMFDLNPDLLVDDGDFALFVQAYATGLCP